MGVEVAGQEGAQAERAQGASQQQHRHAGELLRTVCTSVHVCTCSLERACCQWELVALFPWAWSVQCAWVPGSADTV